MEIRSSARATSASARVSPIRRHRASRHVRIEARRLLRTQADDGALADSRCSGHGPCPCPPRSDRDAHTHAPGPGRDPVFHSSCTPPAAPTAVCGPCARLLNKRLRARRKACPILGQCTVSTEHCEETAMHRVKSLPEYPSGTLRSLETVEFSGTQRLVSQARHRGAASQGHGGRLLRQPRRGQLRLRAADRRVVRAPQHRQSRAALHAGTESITAPARRWNSPSPS